MSVKFSIIMPTVDVPVGTGRSPVYLKGALQSVLNAGWNDFEVLVGCDGDIDEIKNTVLSLNDQRFKYIPCKFTGHWGNPQRNQLQKIATGTHINYLDHDDVYIPGALGRVAEMSEAFPDKLLVYKIFNIHGQERWERPYEVKPLMIGGQMMVVPNDGDVPDWTPEDYYSADLNFCKAVTSKYERNGRGSVWVPEVIQQLRPWAILPMKEYKQALDLLRKQTLKDLSDIVTNPQPVDG